MISKKMLYFRKFFVIILALFICLTTSGCNFLKQTENEEEIIVETDYYLVKDGKTDYTIVLPKDCDKNISFAAEELVQFFKEATGIKISVKSDDEIASIGEEGYINLGNTTFSKNIGFIDVPGTLGEQGYVIKTVNGNVFIWSEGSIGILYGVYEFLSREFGYECYYEDVFSIEKGVSEKKLMGFDLVDKPDFTYRKTGYTNIVKGEFANRLKMNYATSFMRVGGADVHNAIFYVAPAKFESTHPKWYDEGTKNNQLMFRQLCYTAHGDATELAAMREEVLKVLKNTIRDNPDSKYVSFTQADTSAWCNCNACSKTISRNGNCKISTIISFINPVAKELKQWMNDLYPERDVNIVIFAYGPTIDCPAIYDSSTKSYKPYTEEMALCDNVSVYYAPIGADYVSNMNKSVNRSFKENLDKWSALCSDNLCWYYSTIFGEYLDFYNTFDSMQENYKLLKDRGFDFIFDQAQCDVTECTGFSRLKMYLNAKLAWDVDENVEKLTQGFFENYFLDASENMYDLYKSMKDSYNSYYTKGKITGNCNITASMKRTGCVSRTKILEWLDFIDKAFEEVEKYKQTDVELYNTLCDRITIESICVRYLYSEVYPTQLGEGINAFRKELKDDLTRFKFNKWWEGYGINNLFNQWGI